MDPVATARGSDTLFEDPLLSNNYEQASEVELARLARDEDEYAFAEIVRRFSPRVFHVAHRFFRDRSQAEEAAQETFLKAFAQIKSFAGRGSMEGWLTRIATNTCLNMLRSAKRRPELVTSDLTEDETAWLEQVSNSIGAPAPDAEQRVIGVDLADKVLETLNPEDRLALTMIDGEGASVNEVAEVTGWSESKVKVRAFRARKKAREVLKQLLGRRQ
ncbi:MAG TPA: sigma-70 family RNA polymerase sigma factor [Pyrinomonadaceae bacterium]|nr:sigma-70 family RNA polymerase sigma factor [Pyrinomonadaceae bacterium]